MTRQWLSMQVDTFDEVAVIAKLFRSTDQKGQWYFLPHDGAFIQVGLHATATARERLSEAAAGHPGAAPADLRVHHASTELALALRGQPVENLLVGHLAAVTAGLSAADRAAFLFHYWQQCSAGLEPAARVRLGRRADFLATDATTRNRIPAHAFSRWLAYLAAIRETSSTNYALFHHSRLMNDRLGAPAEDQALAARVLRGMRSDVEAARAA